MQRCRDGRAGSCYSPDPVLDAIVDALANICPKCRYVVHGSKNWIDLWCVSIQKMESFFHNIAHVVNSQNQVDISAIRNTRAKDLVL